MTLQDISKNIWVQKFSKTYNLKDISQKYNL